MDAMPWKSDSQLPTYLRLHWPSLPRYFTGRIPLHPSAPHIIISLYFTVRVTVERSLAWAHLLSCANCNGHNWFIKRRYHRSTPICSLRLGVRAWGRISSSISVGQSFKAHACYGVVFPSCLELSQLDLLILESGFITVCLPTYTLELVFWNTWSFPESKHQEPSSCKMAIINGVTKLYAGNAPTVQCMRPGPAWKNHSDQIFGFVAVTACKAMRLGHWHPRDQRVLVPLKHFLMPGYDVGFTMRMYWYVHPWTAHARIPFWSMLTLAAQLQANRKVWLALVPDTITICFASCW